MRRLVLPLSLAAGLFAAACGDDAFTCDNDLQCNPGGVCVSPGYCAFNEPLCDSGLAYGDLAGGGLAGECVFADAVTGGPTPQTTGGPAATTSSGGPADDSDTTAGPETVTLTFPATRATCIFVEADPPDAAACEALSETPAFTIDLQASSELGEAAGFLSFQIGDAVGDATVLGGRLRLHTLPGENAGASAGGELWVVDTFSDATLLVTAPSKLGTSPIAGDVGPVGPDEGVTWTIPGDVVTGTDLYLGVFSTVFDGVDYHAEDGAVPPVLELDVQP